MTQPLSSNAAADHRRLAVFLTGICTMLNIYSTQPLAKDLAAEFGGNPTRATWTIAATTLAVALFAPIAGSIADRLGRKRVILAAMYAMAAMTILCAFATSFLCLLATRFLQGLCIPFIFAVIVAYINEEWPPLEAPKVNALYVSGSVLGGFSGRFLSGLATSTLNWRASFVLLAAITLLIALATGRWLAREQHFHARQSGGFSFADIKQHLGNSKMLATCIIGAAIMFLQVGSFTYAALHLAQPPFSMSTAALGSVFAVFLIGVVVTPWAGRAILRYGRVTTYAAACVLMWIGLLLCLTHTSALVITGLACCSTGVFASQACATGYSAIAAGKAKSSGVGVYLTFYYLGGSLGSTLPGPVFLHQGWPGCIALFAGVVLIGLLAAILAWPHREKMIAAL